MTYNNLPLYDLTIDDTNNTGVFTISLVNEPAIDVDFLRFAAEAPGFAAEQSTDFKFESIDDEQHIVTGPAMIPDVPIFRRDDLGREFYVRFSKDTIKSIAERFMKNEYLHCINLQHKYEADACYVTESYVVNKERGLCPIEFKDINDGTWMVTVKVEDDELWNEIKESGHINGFSVEVVTQAFSVVKEAKAEAKAEPKTRTIDDELNECFNA